MTAVGGYERNSFRELQHLISADLYRYNGESGRRVFWRHLCSGDGSRYMIWCRLTKYLAGRGRLARPAFNVARLVLKHLGLKYGFYIPWWTEIGPGFYIGHPGSIVVSGEAVIGKNCNISHEVTIGVANRGRIGVPKIGDGVYIGPGAKIFGGIRIGDNVAIGANAVVSMNVKSNTIVVAGTTTLIVTDNPEFPIYGAKGYVNYTDFGGR